MAIFFEGEIVSVEVSLFPCFKNSCIIKGDEVLIEASLLTNFENGSSVTDQVSCATFMPILFSLLEICLAVL